MLPLRMPSALGHEVFLAEGEALRLLGMLPWPQSGCGRCAGCCTSPQRCARGLRPGQGVQPHIQPSACILPTCRVLHKPNMPWQEAFLAGVYTL